MRQRLASPVAKPREKVTVICINCAPVVLISLPMIVATMKIRKRAFPRSSFSRLIVRQTAVFIGWCYIYYWKIRVKSSSFERNDFDDYFRWIIVYLRLILIDLCLFDIFFFFFFKDCFEREELWSLVKEKVNCAREKNYFVQRIYTLRSIHVKIPSIVFNSFHFFLNAATFWTDRWSIFKLTINIHEYRINNKACNVIDKQRNYERMFIAHIK